RTVGPAAWNSTKSPPFTLPARSRRPGPVARETSQAIQTAAPTAAARRTPYRPRPEPRRRPSMANAAHMGPALWSAPPTRVNSCLHADVATGSRLRAGGDPDLRHRVRRRYPPPQRAGRRVRACHRRWSAHPAHGREDRPRWAGRRALRLLAAGRVPAGGAGAPVAPGLDSLLLSPLCPR